MARVCVCGPSRRRGRGRYHLVVRSKGAARAPTDGTEGHRGHVGPAKNVHCRPSSRWHGPGAAPWQGRPCVRTLCPGSPSRWPAAARRLITSRLGVGPIQAYLACPGRVAGMRRVGFGVLSSRSRRVFPTESAAIAHHHCGGAWPAPPVWPVRNQTSLSCLARRQSPPAPREN